MSFTVLKSVKKVLKKLLKKIAEKKFKIFSKKVKFSAGFNVYKDRDIFKAAGTAV